MIQTWFSTFFSSTFNSYFFIFILKKNIYRSRDSSRHIDRSSAQLTFNLASPPREPITFSYLLFFSTKQTQTQNPNPKLHFHFIYYIYTYLVWDGGRRDKQRQPNPKTETNRQLRIADEEGENRFHRSRE